MGKALVEPLAVIEVPRRGRVTHTLTGMPVIVTARCSPRSKPSSISPNGRVTREHGRVGSCVRTTAFPLTTRSTRCIWSAPSPPKRGWCLPSTRAGQIRARCADYLLAIKGNQPGLRQALDDAFADQSDGLAHEQTLDRHGRKSIQIAQVIPNAGQVDSTQWSDCASLGRVQSLRVQSGRPRHLLHRLGSA